jgi:hypothetical protein
VVDLVESLHSILDDLSDGHDLIHGIAHGSKCDLVGSALSELREDVGYVVAKRFLLGDANLIIGGALCDVSYLAVC